MICACRSLLTSPPAPSPLLEPLQKSVIPGICFSLRPREPQGAEERPSQLLPRVAVGFRTRTVRRGSGLGGQQLGPGLLLS